MLQRKVCANGKIPHDAKHQLSHGRKSPDGLRQIEKYCPIKDEVSNLALVSSVYGKAPLPVIRMGYNTDPSGPVRKA